MRNIATLSSLLFLVSMNAPALAAPPTAVDVDVTSCPESTYTTTVGGVPYEINDEFGSGTNEITRCLANKKVKLVMQVNQSCRDTTVVPNDPQDLNNGYKLENHPKSCGATRGYGIAQMKNMIRDYVITNQGDPKDLDLIIVVHGGGGLMLIDDQYTPYTNNLQPAVQELLSGGVEGVKVKFYFCMNTIRGLAGKLPFISDSADLVSKLVPDVEFVTGGLTAIGDLQNDGYVYIQP